jgi:hypothetical protein
LIHLAPHRVRLRDLKWTDRSKHLDQFTQRGIRLRPMTLGVMDDGQGIAAKHLVRLP